MTPQLQQLSIDDVLLDETNPRIQRALSMYGDEITADRIALALKEGSDERESSSTTFSRLRNSIIKNRGIITPIIINVRDGQRVCVEGNTRLLIYRELHEDEPNGTWKKIPSLVYDGAGPEIMEAIRLQAHLIGPRPWDPYSKAKYLDYLWNEEYLSEEEIIEYCGGNKKQIQASIAAYRLVENVYRPLLEDDNDFDPTRFSGFVEFQDPKVCRAVYDAGYKDKNFARWLHDRKIVRLEHVRSLPDIFQNEEAKQAFIYGDSLEAIKVLNQPSVDELIAKLSLEELLEIVEKKIYGITYSEVEQYKKEPRTLPSALKSTIETLEDFRKQIASD